MSDWDTWVGDSVFDFDDDGDYDTVEEAGRETSHLRTMGLLDDDDDDDYDYDVDDREDDYEDGSEYGLYPEDFDDEEEYLEALQEAIDFDGADDFSAGSSADLDRWRG
ncbi:MAG: hypothetical protein IJI67_03580 [Clostridia bacterium]|nr:hypothetical protein [Clostridia bacterium]